MTKNPSIEITARHYVERPADRFDSKVVAAQTAKYEAAAQRAPWRKARMDRLLSPYDSRR